MSGFCWCVLERHQPLWRVLGLSRGHLEPTFGRIFRRGINLYLFLVGARQAGRQALAGEWLLCIAFGCPEFIFGASQERLGSVSVRFEAASSIAYEKR